MKSSAKLFQEHKWLILLVVLFFIANVIWIKFENRPLIIGDDARWLEATAEFSEVVSGMDGTEIGKAWQEMFMTNTNSFPRTPLFVLLSVPTFLLVGVSEDAALITNLLVLAVNSLLLAALIWQIFGKNKETKLAALLAVLFYNLLPGIYGFGRLYMSETLQTFFVLLLTLVCFRWAGKQRLWSYPVLGVLLALAFLLRFVIWMYIAIPLCIFVYRQLKLKVGWKYYLLGLIFALSTFLPLAWSWYGPNLRAYLEFAQYTSSGDLAAITSLGPVWSPLTWLRYWYVISIWFIGWPFTVFAVVLLVSVLWLKRKSISKKLLLSHLNRRFLLVLSCLLPALLVTTLSDNKTARYFMPVIPFLVIFVSMIAAKFYRQIRNRLVQTMFIFSLLILAYPFLVSVCGLLPAMPLTTNNYAAGKFRQNSEDWIRYEALFSFYQAQFDNLYAGKDLLILPQELEKGSEEDQLMFNAFLQLEPLYNANEQQRFNDAEIIWYFRQKGLKINTLGEFSAYMDPAQGLVKALESKYVVLESKPEVSERWQDKFTDLRTRILQAEEFKLVFTRELENGSIMEIFENLTYL